MKAGFESPLRPDFIGVPDTECGKKDKNDAATQNAPAKAPSPRPALGSKQRVFKGVRMAEVLDYRIDTDDGKPFALFRINVQWDARHWTVHRRYSDFTDLHALLTHVFPATLLAGLHLPQKRLWHKKDKFDPEQMERRRDQLHSYLNALLDVPALADSDVVAEFLSHAWKKPKKRAIPGAKRLLIAHWQGNGSNRSLVDAEMPPRQIKYIVARTQQSGKKSRAKAGVADASSTRLPSDSLDSLLDDGDVASSAANEKEGGAATRVMAPAVVHDPPMSIGDIAQSVPANGVADASQSLRKEVADRPTPSGGVLPPISGPTATKQPIHDDEPIHSSPQQPAAASEPAAAGVPANDNGQLAEAASQLEALSLGEGAKAPAPKKGTLERSRRSPRMAAVAKQLASDRVTSRQGTPALPTPPHTNNTHWGVAFAPKPRPSILSSASLDSILGRALESHVSEPSVPVGFMDTSYPSRKDVVRRQRRSSDASGRRNSVGLRKSPSSPVGSVEWSSALARKHSSLVRSPTSQSLTTIHDAAAIAE